MGVYHICDFCGIDITDSKTYCIGIYDETTATKLPCQFELCEDCAMQWSNILNRLCASRNDTDWSVTISSPKYRVVDGRAVYRERNTLVDWSAD